MLKRRRKASKATGQPWPQDPLLLCAFVGAVFGMFDFAPVGLVTASVGLLFVARWAGG